MRARVSKRGLAKQEHSNERYFSPCFVREITGLRFSSLAKLTTIKAELHRAAGFQKHSETEQRGWKIVHCKERQRMADKR